MEPRGHFIAAADAVRPLLTGDAVAAMWERPSALAGMTVGALAGHLGRAVTTVDRYLAADPPTPDGSPLDAAGYLLSIEGIGGGEVDLDAPLHQAIRRRASDDAGDGPDAVVRRWDDAVAGLTPKLAVEPSDRRITVLGGRVMLLDEYLVTRLIELVVHGDDLAVSVGRPMPPFPAGTVDLVVTALVAAARRTHGDLAVVRALTRRERDDIEALRVL